jgi:polysaccharide deacetylase family protein (PEP-CTERM system associated)
MRDFVLFEDWDKQELRVHIGVNFILNELDKRNIKATFFILGWIADRCPDLVRRISTLGHEICTHGHSHTPLDLHTPISFEEDLLRSMNSISKITGKKIRGFRAPSFSITDTTLWALDILTKSGIEYDSSIFSTTHPDYGISNFPTRIIQLTGLYEVPLCKSSYIGIKIPVCGGGYFRLLPYWMIKIFLKKSIRHENIVTYFHPWEFDPDQPRINLPIIKKFRHYIGLRNNQNKFIKFLDDFEFTTIETLIHEEYLDFKLMLNS